MREIPIGRRSKFCPACRKLKKLPCHDECGKIMKEIKKATGAYQSRKAKRKGKYGESFVMRFEGL